MSDQSKIFDTLLKHLDSNDYDALIEQEELRKAGYNLHFVIDANLIGNYCFPKGIIIEETSAERLAKLTDNYIADEQVTLHSIFNLNKKNDRVIFFDEHVPEFKSMLVAANIIFKKEEVSLGTERYNYKSISEGEFKEFLYYNFSMVIADVLLKINGLTKAVNLFKDKQIIFEANDFDSDILREATTNCRVTERQEEIIKCWQSLQKSPLHDSKSRDAAIIDRLLAINEYIQSVGVGDDKKHVLIFLTDSINTKPLFLHLKQQKSSIVYPLFENKAIMLIRNVPQSFAYLISLKYTNENEVDISGTINNLKQLKETNGKVMYIIKGTEKIISVTSDGKMEDKSDLFSYDIFKNYKELRNVFENTGLLKSFAGLHSSVKDDIAKLNLSDIKDFFDRVKRLMHTLLHDLTNDHAGFLDKLFYEALFSTAYLKGLKQIRNSSLPLNLSKGSDSVEGSYHHLPIFLSFPLENQMYREHMNYLMLLVLDQKDEKTGLSNQLNALVHKFGLHKGVEDEIEMKILKAFILMIMPSSDTEQQLDFDLDCKGSKNDCIAEKMLEIIYKEKVLSTENHAHLHADLLYQLCWITRRINKCEMAIEYALEGIKTYPDDPRFHHGLFLARYSDFEEENDLPLEKALILLREMLDSLNIAQKLYPSFLVQNFSGFNKELMQLRLMETFYNCSCYINTMIAFEYHNKNNPTHKKTIINYLKIAREHLANLKILYSNIDRQSEYYDTEAFLEYIESYYLEEKLMKAQNAKLAIDKAIALSRSINQTIKYQSKKNKIEKRIQALHEC